MAISGAPITSQSLGRSIELVEMVPSAQHALEVFPSERKRERVSATVAPQPPRSGVVMRVAPLSWGAAWALAAIVLAGAGGIAAIGLLLVGRAR